MFEGTIWLNKMVKRAQDAVSSSQGDASIPPVAVTTEYALPFVAALVGARNNILRILDFGGGMGTSYAPLVPMLRAHLAIDFVVVENAKVCEKGRELFSDDPRIRFVTEIPDGESFDIVHAGSSIHYVDDWLGLLKQFERLEPEFVLVSDLPAGDIHTFVTAQMFYGRRIPVRFWNLGEFVSAVEARGYELLFKARYRGYYLASDEEPPMAHFAPEYRLNYFSQLIFRRVAQ